VIVPHSCFTMESLLTSLSIEGRYVGSKNTTFWDIFTAVSIIHVFEIEVFLGSRASPMRETDNLASICKPIV
jgi:hypothetical protein